MNNNKLINLLLNFLQVFMQMCIVVPMVNILLHGFMRYETFHALPTLYMGVVVFIFYVAKVCIKNGKLSVMVHLMAIASIWFVVQGSLEDKLLVIIPALVWFNYSMKRTTQKPFLPLDMGILIGTYILGTTITAESGTVIPLYCTVIYIISYAIWYDIENVNKLVLENGSVKSFNAEQAINVNSIMLSIFLVIMLIAMAILPNRKLQALLNGFLLMTWRIVLAGFKALNIPMPEGGYELEQSLENKQEHYEETGGLMLDMTEGNMVLDLIAAAFALVIFVCMLVLVLKSLKDLRYRHSKGNDVKEFIKPETLKKEKKKEKEQKNFFFNTPNEIAVRKLYQAIITKKLKKGQSVQKSDAPTQITKNVVGLDDKTVAMTQIYEKARYGDEKITQDEVNVLREVRKNL